MIQRINGKLAFEQEKVISTTNRNSVTYRIGAKGEAIIHGHGVYSDKEDRIIGDMDYNNQFSNTDTDTFVKMGDAVIYDVLVGQNGSIQVREKYQIGRRWIVTAPIIISNPIRDTPSR